MRILRHPIRIDDYQTIALPNHGELLSVAVSRAAPNRRIDLWSLDFEQGEGRAVGIYVVGTGNPMPSELGPTLVPGWFGGADTVIPQLTQRFLGTVVTSSDLVWHVFEGPVQ